MPKGGNIGNTFSLSAPHNYNAAHSGQAYTLYLTSGMKFFAGLAFDGVKALTRAGVGLGLQYSDANNQLTAFLDTTTKIKYLSGETELLTAMDDAEIIRGSVVEIRNAADERNNGIYIVASFDASDAELVLERPSYNGFLGDVQDGVTNEDDDTAEVILYPFSNAFKIVSFTNHAAGAAASSTITEIGANNLGGATMANVELVYGIPLEADIYYLSAGDPFLVYCQAAPSLAFLPKNNALDSTLA
jgi:hypothetical protein